MALTVTEKQQGKIIVVAVSGDVDSSSVSVLAAGFSEIKEKNGAGKYVVDMAGLEFISSAGWTFFVKECKALRAAGGDIKFAGMIQSVERIYDLVGIDSLIKAYESVEKAITNY